MSLIDIFFPKQCIICSRVGFDICDRCFTKLSKALPTCFVCRKISTNGRVHRSCLDTDNRVTYIQGWKISQRYNALFEEKKNKNIYSIYTYLLQYILDRYKIKKEEYNIFSLQISWVKDRDRKAEKICFIGERIENEEALIEQIKKYSQKDILIITLF